MHVNLRYSGRYRSLWLICRHPECCAQSLVSQTRPAATRSAFGIMHFDPNMNPLHVTSDLNKYFYPVIVWFGTLSVSVFLSAPYLNFEYQYFSHWFTDFRKISLWTTWCSLFYLDLSRLIWRPYEVVRWDRYHWKKKSSVKCKIWQSLEMFWFEYYYIFKWNSSSDML
jgi:hypothetical protein